MPARSVYLYTFFSQCQVDTGMPPALEPHTSVKQLDVSGKLRRRPHNDYSEVRCFSLVRPAATVRTSVCRPHRFLSHSSSFASSPPASQSFYGKCYHRAKHVRAPIGAAVMRGAASATFTRVAREVNQCFLHAFAGVCFQVDLVLGIAAPASGWEGPAGGVVLSGRGVCCGWWLESLWSSDGYPPAYT